jgi:predicted nucleic acid-binding protein
VSAVYVDTSALGRVLLEEPDAHAVKRDLARFDQWIASRLLRVELRRLGLREDAFEAAEQLVGGLALVPVDDTILLAAESVPPSTVATLDAIHLVTALRLAEVGLLDAVMTYDVRLADGARQHGLTVLAPA